MKFLSTVPILLVLVGCASFSEIKPVMYSRGEKSPESFEAESADCEMKASANQSMGGTGGLAGLAFYYETYNKVFDACMRSKRYRRTPYNPMN